jgi:hypothetical protein
MREVFSETENKGGASSIESSTLLDVIESSRRGKRLNQAQVPCHSVAFSLSVLLSPSSLSLSPSLSLSLDQSIDLFLSLSTKGADNLAAKLFALCTRLYDASPEYLLRDISLERGFAAYPAQHLHARSINAVDMTRRTRQSFSLVPRYGVAHNSARASSLFLSLLADDDYRRENGLGAPLEKCLGGARQG